MSACVGMPVVGAGIQLGAGREADTQPDCAFYNKITLSSNCGHLATIVRTRSKGEMI